MIGNRICLDEQPKLMSRQSVRNIIIKEEISKPKIEKLETPESLFIIADEKWISTQNNKKKKVMQKSIVIFDGFIKTGKRKSLKNKMTFSGRNDNFIYDAIDYIENAYSTSKIKTFYMLGDGAQWIKGLKYYFNYNNNIQIIQALDHFHLKQAIWRLYPEEDVYDTLCECIYKNDKTNFERLANEIIDLKPHRKDKIEEYKNYILNNFDIIINLFKYKLSCPMESQISHTFASYFTSRPKGYNKNTLNKLIKLRLLKKNKYNIKMLHLNNFDKKEEIDLNNNNINYSIFNIERKCSFVSLNKQHYYQ